MVARQGVPTIKELRECARARRNNPLRGLCWKIVLTLQYTHIFHRPISIYFTKLFLAVRLTPDTITLVSYAFTVVAGVLFISGNYWYALIGVALYQIYLMLDCCDGIMSCYMYGENNNPRGGFLEDMGHSILQPFITICVAFGVYNNPQCFLVGSLFHHNLAILVIGFVGSSLFLTLHAFDRYSKAKAIATSFVTRSRFRAWVNENTYSDLLLLVTVITNTLWLYLILWAIIFLLLVVVNGVTSYWRLPKPEVLGKGEE